MPPDVYILNPDYPYCVIDDYIPPSPPQPQTSLACPECHRQFPQAGMLKRFLQQMHQIPWLSEDVFRPLRDGFDGRPIYNHCKFEFATIYSFRDHINKRACHAFDSTQAIIFPIVAREDLRMHVRHRSFMGLMLDGSLCSELVIRCALCNVIIYVRIMIRYFHRCSP